MKFLGFTIIALAVYVAAAEEWSPIRDKATFSKIHEECSKQTGLTAEQDKKILSAEYPDEKAIHDYILCADKKIGIFDDDKGYDLKRIMAQLDALLGGAEEFREIVAKCIDSNEQKSSPAEWAYRIKVCIMKTKIGAMVKESGKTHIS